MLVPLHLHPRDRSHAALIQRAELHFRMAQINPAGFRTPGRNGTSSAEKAAIAAGMLSGKRERSARGQRKAKAKALHIENVKEQQLRGLEHRRIRERRRL